AHFPAVTGRANRVDMLAADGARHTTVAGLRARRAQLLRREMRRFVERPALEIARRQRAETIEGQQIGRGAKLAILRGGGAERSLRQVLADRGQIARVRPLDTL